jgi:hypothetical protein
VLLLHILLFDKAYNLTYWLNYSELKSQLRRRHQVIGNQVVEYHTDTADSLLALRLAIPGQRAAFQLKSQLLSNSGLVHDRFLG